MNDIRPSVIKNNLFEAIENKEITTKENLSLADKINFNPIDNKIISLKPQMEALSDEELRGKTDEFRQGTLSEKGNSKFAFS